MLREVDYPGPLFLDVLSVFIDPRGGWQEPAEDRGPGGSAERGRAVGIGEDSSSGGQSVHVGGLDLGMASKEANPVVQVVYGDEEDIGSSVSLLGGYRVAGSDRKDSDDQEDEVALTPSHECSPKEKMKAQQDSFQTCSSIRQLITRSAPARVQIDRGGIYTWTVGLPD